MRVTGTTWAIVAHFREIRRFGAVHTAEMQRAVVPRSLALAEKALIVTIKRNWHVLLRNPAQVGANLFGWWLGGWDASEARVARRRGTIVTDFENLSATGRTHSPKATFTPRSISLRQTGSLCGCGLSK